jgi:hypothetical protein
MSKAVLIVEKSDRVRAGLRAAISARGLPIYDVTDAFDAMSALGRADFGAIVVSVGKRQLSLKGLCQLARRRHPGIRIFIIFYAGIEVAPIAQALGVDFDIVQPGTTTVVLAERIDHALKAQSRFADVPHTLDGGAGSDELDVSVEDEEPTVSTPLSPAAQAALQAMNARDAAPAQKAVQNAPLPSLLVERAPDPVDVAPTVPTAPPRTVAEKLAGRTSVTSPSTQGQSLSGPTIVDAHPTSTPRPLTDPWARPLEASQTPDDEKTIRNPVSPRPAPARAALVLPSDIDSPPPPILEELNETSVDLFVIPTSKQSTSTQPSSRQPTSTQSGPAAAVPTLVSARPISVELPALAPVSRPSVPAPTVRMNLDDGFAAKETVLDVPTELVFDAPGADIAASLDEGLTAQHLVGDTISGSTAEAEPLFGGTLDGAGPALLVSLMAQEFNGRLDVADSDVNGSVFFFAGEPVWAIHPDGDLGIATKLRAVNLLPDDFDRSGIVEGQLLAKMVERGVMTGQAMHDFMRGFLRDAVLNLCTTTKGVYAFYEESAFIETVPLVKVNSFGLMLESRRRRTPPDELLRLSQELEWKYLIPGPALTPAAPKLRAFVRGNDLAEVINGLRRTKHFLQVTQLDAIMGSLVILTLTDARLIAIADEPKTELPTVALADSTQVDTSRLAVPDSDVADPSASREERQAIDEIFTLYMQLKPLSEPSDVLGVSGEASSDDIQKAFHLRMKQLEVTRIPEGSARDLMVSRVEELRLKVQRAFESLTDRTLT